MTTSMTVAEVRDMLDAVAGRMIENVDLLTEADQAIGDGDHGIGMRRGFTAAREQLARSEFGSVGDVFKAVGMAVMSQTGGASGAIFGTLFRAGANACPGDQLTRDTFAALLELGLAAVQKRGGVGEGGKTMIDALAPAARAAAAEGGDLQAAMAAAAAAAKHGVEATKAMRASTGKARTLGDRSLGHPDPGAISMFLILSAMRDFSGKITSQDQHG